MNLTNRKRNSLVSKCASCAGGVGVALCTVFMTFGAIGIVAVGFSKNMGNMNGMGSVENSSLLGQVSLFFASSFGKSVLLVFIALMIIGLWLHGGKISVLILSLLGSTILFVGMYVYFSIALELAASVLLVLAYFVSYQLIRRRSKQIGTLVKLQ
jgi:hypothetical protein